MTSPLENEFQPSNLFLIWFLFNWQPPGSFLCWLPFFEKVSLFLLINFSYAVFLTMHWNTASVPRFAFEKILLWKSSFLACYLNSLCLSSRIFLLLSPCKWELWQHPISVLNNSRKHSLIQGPNDMVWSHSCYWTLLTSKTPSGNPPRPI